VDAGSPAEETKEAKAVAQMLEEMYSSRSSFQSSIWFVGYVVMMSNGGTSNW